jgi:hypothetical protein
VKQPGRIWKQFDELATRRHVSVMNELGIHPVWCEHTEIPGIIDRVIGR